MTQRERVLNMLRDAGSDGVSSNRFYSACLPRFSARIHELRNAGHTITKEPVEQGHFLYRLVERGDCDTSASRASVPTLGQSPTTPGRGGDGQVLHVAGESSTSIGAEISPSSEPRDAAPKPRQVTDADGSPGRDPSASLLLFDMPVTSYQDAA